MSHADAVDATRCPSGIYRIDAAQRARIASGDAFPTGFHVAVLDGSVATSREDFFTEIARALCFPDYFGRNWDAVYDCLTDLSWLPAEGFVLLLDGFGQISRDDPRQWQIALKILRDACDFWRPFARPMYALLYDAANRTPGLAALPSTCLHVHTDGE